jgi:hypothetical protein
MSGVAVQSSVQACSIGHTNTEAVVPCSVAGLTRRRCLQSLMDDGGGVGLAASTRSPVEKRVVDSIFDTSDQRGSRCFCRPVRA